MDSLQRSSSWLSGLPFGLLMLVLVTGGAAKAAEIKVLSAGGFGVVMRDLGPKFERASGHSLSITFAAPGLIVQRVLGGEINDVVILPRAGIDSLVKDGKAIAANVTALAGSGIGVAIRKGAPKPDISSPEALKRTLLAARSISYANPASGFSSGVHFAKVLDRLGIASEMKPKTVFPPQGGVVGELAANGEAEIAVNQFQELIPVVGIEIVGPLPGDLQDAIVFSAAIIAGASNAVLARAFVDFLRTPEAMAVIKAKGMEPVTP